MTIDWFTVFAQIINFIILIFVLKKLLYKPILNKISERKQLIENKISEADKQKEQFLSEKKFYEDKKNEFIKHEKQQKKQLANQIEEEKKLALANLNLEIQEEKQQIIEEFRHQQLVKYHQSLLSLLTDSIKLVFKDLSSVSFEEQSLLKLLEEIRFSDETLLNKKEISGKIVIRHSFNFSNSLKNNINSQLTEIFKQDIECEFVFDKNIVWGVWIMIDDYHVEWTLECYLKQLEQSLVNSYE